MTNLAISTMNNIASMMKPAVENLGKKVSGVTHYIPTSVIDQAKNNALTHDAVTLLSKVKTPLKSENLVGTLATLNGIWMAGFYIWNTNNNKKIPDERKQTLNLNTIITTSLALGLGFAFDPAKKKFIESLKDKVKGEELLKNLSEKTKNIVINNILENKETLAQAREAISSTGKKLTDVKQIATEYLPKFLEETTKKGIKSIIDLVYITAAFRFIAPVTATPLAEMANKFLVKHNFMSAPKEKKAETVKIATANTPEPKVTTAKTQSKTVAKFA